MVSAITERPYTFLRWLTGTLPGRKPLRRTLSLRSTRRASALASRSDAGTLIWNSCFNPSARVSVTCIASIFFSLGPAQAATLSIWSDARHQSLASVVRRTKPFRGNLPLRRKVPPISSCKRCQRLVRAEGASALILLSPHSLDIALLFAYCCVVNRCGYGQQS